MFYEIFIDREVYRMKRLKNKIKLKDVARYVGCSTTTLSRFENENNFIMSNEKIRDYKEYIDKFDKSHLKGE